MNWYIDTQITDENYLKMVKLITGDIMDWFCDQLSSIKEDEFNEEKIINLCKEIFEKLPILRFKKKSDFKYHDFEDSFWIYYNSDVNIRFKNPLKSIKRDIIINNLLNEVDPIR